MWNESQTPSTLQAKAHKLIGETIYLYEPEDATVRITIEPQLPGMPLPDRFLYLDVKNRLDEKDALLIARLMPRITPPMAVFFLMVLVFRDTPELPPDAPHGGSYFNPALFSLPGSDADGGGGGGDMVKLITRYLNFTCMVLQEGLPRGMTRTAELSVQCQELFLPYHRTLLPAFIDFLPQVAVARPLNAPAKITADEMEDGRLDEILDFFTHIAIGFESAAPCLRVRIDNPSAWPESLPKQSAINPREEQLAERLYKFQLYNGETGEKLEVEVRGSFANIDDEGKGEAGLRVSGMVLHFRPDDADK